MAEFEYRARNKDGQIESDVITAASRAAATSQLRSQGLLPVFLKERSRMDALDKLNALFRRISLNEKLTFVNNLAVMNRAGVAVPRALRILAKQSENPKFQETVSDMAHEVETGKSLSQAFAKYPNIFSGLYVNLVEVGEASGTLDHNLEYLVSLIRRESELIKKTKGALTYPLVVVATLVLVGILMFIFVLPKLTATFAEFDVELPILTRVLIATVDLFSSYVLFIIPLLIALIGTGIYFLKTPAGKALTHKAMIKLPVISGITKKINMARFTLTLGSLLKSGMQIVNALKISSRSLGNMYYSKATETVADKVRVGVNLSDALEAYPDLFPSLTTQMIRVGEESGTIEDILKELGDYYEEEVDQIMKNLSSIIEPVLVVVIGAVVGFIAVALIMPIYSITQAV